MTAYLPPLHVHILRRELGPQSTVAAQARADAAAATARALDELLQGDPLLYAVSPVDVPSFRLGLLDDAPMRVPWADAARHAIVLFLDDGLHAERDLWGPRLDELVRECDAHGGLILVVSADAATVPNLSPALARKQLVRVPASAPEGTSLADLWKVLVTLRVFRALATCLAGNGEGLGRLFLSHAKTDGLWLAEAIRDELGRHVGDVTFFDAVSLREGEDFHEGLLAGFEGAVVVTLVTDDWSGRYWCGWEVVRGKDLRCPFLAVDLLDEGEPRSLRYAGNARTLRWTSPLPRDEAARAAWAPSRQDRSPEAEQKRRAILQIAGAALIELVRARHGRARIEAARRAGAIPEQAIVLGAPLEMATLPPFEPGRSWQVVHPDPALPTAERELVRRVRPDVHVASLTEALAGRLLGAWPRPLRVAVSISDPPPRELAARGLTPDHLSRLWSRLALQLLLAGARLGYGGDLRKLGYTERLGDLLMSLAELNRGPAQDAVSVFLGWPFWLGIEPEVWARYPRAVTWHRLAPPAGLALAPDARLVPDWRDAEVQLAYTVSLRAMRERMARTHDARVIVGGQHLALGPVPGLAEELTTFLDLGKPVYLLGGFGGMASVLGRALLGERPEELTLAYQDEGGRRAAIREAIDRAAIERRFSDGGVLRPSGGIEDAGRPVQLAPDGVPALVARLNAAGLAGLRNGLRIDENLRLLATRDPVEALSLILLGLARVAPMGAQET